MSDRSHLPRSRRPRLDVGPSLTSAHPTTKLPNRISVGAILAHPRKRFGQHFLTDPNILRKIVEAAEIKKGDLVLEIGPGLGHLTRALIAAGARLLAIEIDRDLAAQLREEGEAESELTVLEGDFLSRSPEEWLVSARLEGTGYKVVANLPYYITSAVLRHLLEAIQKPSLIVVMVQREVAQELTAGPPHMSLLAVSAQFYARARVVAQVPAGAFFPRPKVDSALVRLDVDMPSRHPMTEPSKFFKIVRAGFGNRRKQLHNALAQGLAMESSEVDAWLLNSGVDPRRRAETLTLAEWQRVYDESPGIAARGRQHRPGGTIRAT